jgi:hypothetical protein
MYADENKTQQVQMTELETEIMEVVPNNPEVLADMYNYILKESRYLKVYDWGRLDGLIDEVKGLREYIIEYIDSDVDIQYNKWKRLVDTVLEIPCMNPFCLQIDIYSEKSMYSVYKPKIVDKDSLGNYCQEWSPVLFRLLQMKYIRDAMERLRVIYLQALAKDQPQ